MASSARIDELRKKFDENPRRYFAPLANEYRKAGDLEQAIFICQEYLPQQPGHMSGHIVYGQALFELARLDEARAVFETALSLDPENLIALRHLGDIARQTGDSTSARSWYQRVLEADPRNEEIAQLMLTLLGTPEGSLAAVPPGYGAPASMPAVDFSDLDEPGEAPGGFSSGSAVSDDDEEGFRVEKSQDRSDLAVGPELSDLPERQAAPPTAPTPAWGSASPIEPPHELMDLHDFTVGGVQLSSLAASTPVEPPPAEPFPDASLGEEFDDRADDSEEQEFTESSDAFVAADSPDGSAEFARRVGSHPPAEERFDLENDDGTFEPDSFAITGRSHTDEDAEVPEEESGTDIALGLPDDGTSPTLADPQDNAAIGSVLGLETFEAGSIGAVPNEPTALELESFFETMPVTPPAEDAIAPEPVADEPVVNEPVVDEPVVGEPVAEAPIADGAVTEVTAEAWRYETSLTDELSPDERAGDAVIVDELFGGHPVPDEAEVPEPAALEPDSPIAAAMDDGQQVPADGGVGFVEPEPPEAFVTETMAELYLQQGHVESALNIYQRLVEQRPDEPQLQERLRAIEGLARGTSMAEETESVEAASRAAEDVAPEAPVYDGPTIREFLVGLIRTRSASLRDQPLYHDSSLAHDESNAGAFADDDFTSVYDERVVAEVVEIVDDVAQPDAPAPTMSRATPLSSETISGNIDALFTGADASSSDATAASTLAQAFPPEGPDTAALQGVPAHKASSELSLDHVFKTTQAPRPDSDSGGFSFDQFFADDLGETSTKPGTEPPAPAGDGSDDIAQFNNWLNGLKKT